MDPVAPAPIAERPGAVAKTLKRLPIYATKTWRTLLGTRVPGWVYPAFGLAAASPIVASKIVEKNREEKRKTEELRAILEQRQPIDWGARLQAVQQRQDPEGLLARRQMTLDKMSAFMKQARAQNSMRASETGK